MAKTLKKVALGTLIASAIAAIGITAFLKTTKGKKTKKEIEKLAKEFKKDLLAKARKIKEISKEKYEKIVDELSDFYIRVKKVKEEDLKEIVAFLKAKWPQIEKKLKSKVEK
jgi:replicative DNA helicase